MKLIMVIVFLLFVTLTEQKSKKSYTASYRLIKAACVKRMKPTTNSPPETRELPFMYNLLDYLEKRSGRHTPGNKVDPDHFASDKHISLNTARILAALVRSLPTSTSEIHKEIQDLHKRLLMKRLTAARKRKMKQILRKFTGTVRHGVIRDVIASGDPKVGLDMVCSIVKAGLLEK